MNKKSYTKPVAQPVHIRTAGNIADEVIINTSNAVPVSGGGDLNAKFTVFYDFDDEEDVSATSAMSNRFKSVWDDE